MYQHTSQFSWAENERRLRDELDKWGAKEYLLSSGRQEQAKAKGVRPTPAYSQTPEEARVTLTIRWVKPQPRELTLRYNKQPRDVDNLSVIRLAVEALRLNEKRGIDDVMREAYLQLPAAPVKRSPYEVLNISPSAPLEVAEASYRALAKLLHPDKIDGDEAAMKALNAAIEQLRQGQTAMGTGR